LAVPSHSPLTFSGRRPIKPLAISDVAFFARLAEAYTPTIVRSDAGTATVFLFIIFFRPFGSNSAQIGYSSGEVPISCRTGGLDIKPIEAWRSV
jgi:hypothetical protein